MSTDIQICSNALLLIGHTPIDSFNDGTLGAQVASNFYPTTVKSMLTSHRWRFAVKKAVLSKLPAKPLNQWAYIYQLPANYLSAIRVDPESNYEIFEDKLYSQLSAIQLDYIFRPTEALFPVYFEEALEYKLAAKFAFPVTSNRALSETYQAAYLQQLRVAKFTDSQARPQAPLQDSPFIDVRG